jgi:hypothetical protein
MDFGASKGDNNHIYLFGTPKQRIEKNEEDGGWSVSSYPFFPNFPGQTPGTFAGSTVTLKKEDTISESCTFENRLTCYNSFVHALRNHYRGRDHYKKKTVGATKTVVNNLEVNCFYLITSLFRLISFQT